MAQKHFAFFTPPASLAETALGGDRRLPPRRHPRGKRAGGSYLSLDLVPFAAGDVGKPQGQPTCILGGSSSNPKRHIPMLDPREALVAGTFHFFPKEWPIRCSPTASNPAGRIIFWLPVLVEFPLREGR